MRHLLVEYDEGEETNVNNIIVTNKIFWDAIFDVPVPEGHVGRERLPWRRGIERDVEAIQLSVLEFFIDIEEPDSTNAVIQFS